MNLSECKELTNFVPSHSGFSAKSMEERMKTPLMRRVKWSGKMVGRIFTCGYSR